MEANQQKSSGTEKLVDFTIKLLAVLVVNFFTWKKLYQHHMITKMWAEIAGLAIASFLLVYFIHPWRKRRRAARRAVIVKDRFN